MVAARRIRLSAKATTSITATRLFFINQKKIYKTATKDRKTLATITEKPVAAITGGGISP